MANALPSRISGGICAVAASALEVEVAEPLVAPVSIDNRFFRQLNEKVPRTVLPDAPIETDPEE